MAAWRMNVLFGESVVVIKQRRMAQSRKQPRTPEKGTGQNLEGYVVQLSPIQTAKSNSSTKFFDMTFKTEDEKFRAVCFSPEKRRRLEKYFESGTSCQVTNVMTGNNKMEVKLTNFSSIKPKTVPFKNEKIEWQYHTIDDIINENFRN